MLTLIRNITWVFLAQLLAWACVLLPSRPACAAGQGNSILSGQVHDQDKRPVPGVVVTVQGLGAAATTNASGNFVLRCEEDAPVLVLKCAGYQTQTLPVQQSGPLDITLYKIKDGAPVAGSLAAAGPAAVPDEPPAFPGGVAAYRSYLKQNFRYPEEAKKQTTTCSVLVGFVVDEVGRILDAEVARSCGSGLDEEALRLVRLMPWWTPARKQGKPMRTTTYLRIKFELQ